MKKTCFIICPISNEGTDIRKRSDQLMKHIIDPVCKDKGFEVVRIDKLQHNTSITDEIKKYLQNSDLVISDITDHNPNCFYESGYREAFNKPLIFMKNKGTSIPFDISTTRNLEYNLSDPDDVEKAKQELSSTIAGIDFKVETKDEVRSTNYDRDLNKILNVVLNLDDKITKFNSEIISTITEKMTEKMLNISRPKNDNEIFADILKATLVNPKALETLIELGKINSRENE